MGINFTKIKCSFIISYNFSKFQVDSKPTAAGEIPSLDVRVQNPTGRFGGDGKNIAVLLFLYVLQGIPLGLAAAVPLILTNKHVSYR